MSTLSAGGYGAPKRSEASTGNALDRVVAVACHLPGVDGALVLLEQQDVPADVLQVVAGAGAGEVHRGRLMPAGSLDGLGAMAHVPIFDAARRLGTLAALGDGAGRVDEQADLHSALDGLAGLAASGLRGDANKSAVDQLVDAGVGALATLLDLRDGYTGDHSDRLVALCVDLGERLALVPDALRQLRIAARLHDLGKIGVPDVILHKPGRLTPQEWEVMRKHPEWGAAALEGVPATMGIAAAIRGHHEQWDGRGYPDGLIGEQIPIASRIIAVGDVWAAMTSNRSYRRALDGEHAAQELRDGAGTHFDPAVVDVLLDILAPHERHGRFSRDSRGGGAGDPPPTDGDRDTRRRERASVLAPAMARVAKLPALGESRERMEQLLTRGAGSDGDLLAVVEADLALTVAVIRAGNALGEGAEITSVAEALRRLTREQLTAVVRAMGSIDYFQRVAGWEQPLEHQRLHAVATQRATELISRMLQRRDHDTLLVGALLHDIGKLVLEQAYPSYPRAVHGDADTPDARARAEQRVLGVDHALVGGLMLRRWGMPDVIAKMVERHHSQEAEGAAAILRVADMLANYAHARPIDPQVMLHATAAVGLSPQQLRALMFDLSRSSEAAPRATEPSPLSRSEQSILRGLADGKVYKEIAHDLGLSVSTVRSHCHNVYRKLDVADRSQAVLQAASRGWL